MRPPGMGTGMMATPVDSFVAERDSITKVLLEDLGDKQSAPAESVFHNLKLIKGRTAKQVVDGMNGFSHALGVSCRFCHVAGHWKDDDKKPKSIARSMMLMTSVVNDSLSKMDFGDDHPHVGCFTCHRGERDPGASMRRMMRPPGGPGGPPGGPGGEHREGDHH